MPSYTLYSTTDDADMLSSQLTGNYTQASEGTSILTTNTTAATSGTGQALLAGDDYYCNCSLFDFDLSSMGAGETVTAATFSLYGSADNSTTDFNAKLLSFDWGTGATNADWRTPTQLAALTELAGYATSGGWSTVGYNNFTQTGTALVDAIQTAYNAAVELRCITASDEQIAASAPTGSEYVNYYLADQAGTTNDPKLAITTTAGGAGIAIPVITRQFRQRWS